MDEKKDLMIKAEELREELRRVNNAIEAINEKKLPEIKQKYIGRCYKDFNGDGSERWECFSIITDVKSVYGKNVYVETMTVEVWGSGKRAEIQSQDEGYISGLGKEVSYKEFVRQYTKAKKIIESKLF